MKPRILFCLLFVTIKAFADHPGEGGDNLPDLINEAIANSASLQAKGEFLEAAKDHASATRSGYAPTLSAAGGRRLDGGSDIPSSSANFAQLDAIWNLYRGGADSTKHSMARTEVEISTREQQAKRLEVATAVAETFYEMQYVSESIALIDKMILLTRPGKDIARKRSSTGQTSSIDAIEFDILDSKLHSQRAAYQSDELTLEQRMRGYLGRPDSKPVKVRGHLNRQTWQVIRTELTAKALTENPDAAIAALHAEKAKLAVTAANSGFLPSVDAKGSWGKLANRDRALSEPTWSTELRVTLPLFNGLSTVRERQSHTHQKAAYELESQNLRRHIQTQLSDQLNRLKSVEQRLSIEENSASQAERYLKMTQSEYERGIRNSPDLAAAIDLVLGAHLRNLELRREWHQAKTRAQALTGVIPSA